MENLLQDSLLRDSDVRIPNSRNRGPSDLVSFDSVKVPNFWGEDHLVGTVYGLVNFILCVPALVSYAHIVFTSAEFSSIMPYIVKLYFLSSAVMQATFTMKSSIAFSIGQVQDVGLIFLAAMVRNLVALAREANASLPELFATALWQCAGSTAFVGICLIVIGRLRMSQYVQLLPLPVVGGYLGYIGYFCLVAGLSIASGKELSGPSSLIQLVDAQLAPKLLQLAAMTIPMLFVQFKVKHFLAMPILLLLLPVAFFVIVWMVGVSKDESVQNGWVPQPLDRPTCGIGAVYLFDPSLVHWHLLPRQIASIIGLLIIVAFGSSLDVAAIQAELDTQKIDYNHELTTIGIGNLFSGLLGGATGSYIFSQTIFSAKRAVKSRMNGVVVLVGEFLLFLWPVDILQFFPNSYVGGIMCLLGIDIMKDWLISSRALMSRAEFLLVWLSFAITMWLTSIETFGVIEGMAVGTLVASLVFAIQYSRDHVSWTVLQNRSSVVRPPRERRKLAEDSGSILAVTLNSFAFFGASLYMSQAIEAEVRSRRPRYVCLDFGRLNGIDSTAADQLRLLALSLERLGCMIRLSSMRSTTVKRLLEAHGVVSDTRDRPVFSTIDLAVQHCEEAILAECRTLSRAKSQEEQPLQQLLLDYVDGFLVTSVSIEAAALNARELCAHFDRCVIAPGAFVFRKEELCDAIYVIAAGTLSMYIDQGTRQNDRSGSSNDSPLTLWSPQSKPLQTCQTKSALDLDACDKPEQAVDLHAPEESLVQSTGVGGILGDTAFYARRVYGIDAWAGESGCVLHRISRKRIDELEITSPGLVAFLQKVVLRDLTQLQVQYLGPLQIASGLN